MTTRPPFATTDRPFCECGWPMPGQIEIVGVSVQSLRVRCPMCGKWHADAEDASPQARRDRFVVIDGGG